MTDFLLSMNKVSKFYDAKGDSFLCAVEDLSFNLKEKEFVCILGPTGCGKSTLLKMIGGVEKPTLGSLRLKNEQFDQGIPPHALKSFGYVFQHDNLLPWRTVSQNLRLPLEIFGLKGNEWFNRIDEMLKLVGLADYKNVYPHELSGGMRQRVNLARAMIHNPDILLLDQPLGALDTLTRKILAHEILKISRETQKTILMVTNDVDEALLLSNRILIFSTLPGTIAHEINNDIPQEVRTESLYENPQFIHLRSYISNLIRQKNSPGQVISREVL